MTGQGQPSGQNEGLDSGVRVRVRLRGQGSGVWVRVGSGSGLGTGLGSGIKGRWGSGSGFRLGSGVYCIFLTSNTNNVNHISWTLIHQNWTTKIQPQIGKNSLNKNNLQKLASPAIR